ncbi:MAG: cobalamin biosynthesis protein [Rhodobacteraceae bacterium]|nr:cobalamin biosynthesis protein [Paracoccaceae bacterium]
MTHAASLAVALLLDAWLGEPRWLWDRLPHPAVLMGRAVGAADRVFNHGTARARRLKGIAVMAGLGAAAVGLGCAVSVLPGAGLIDIAAAAILLAQRSLTDHVRAVADALRHSVEDGRHAVAQIVGRDTAGMDGPAIARAAIESAAENLSDGVVAPAFWFLIGGLPGLLLYKITNTADSMIGYRTPRHQAFGWAAARFDDLLNWAPARLTALLIAALRPRPDLWRTIRADAPLHRSPNAGWPEAAMATRLDVALSGPRSYDGQIRDFPWVRASGKRTIGAAEINAAVAVLWQVWRLMLAGVVLLALV